MQTSPRRPSAQPTEEATREGLRLARESGDAFERAVRHMVQDVAKGGDEHAAGEYRVAFAFEAPEGLYDWVGGEVGLQWREPQDENLHLEVAVRDGADGRFVPYLEVSATLVHEDDRKTGPFQLPFLWHPTLYHYGSNIRIPRAGKYNIIVDIDPPTFSRHDRENGCRFTRRVTAEFHGVQLDPLEAH